MEWTDEQKENIINHYGSVEEYERLLKQREAQGFLDSTDYIVIKAYEYFMSGKELKKDYTETFKKREEARKTLRGLEN